MYLLAGYTPLKVFIVYRTVFNSQEELTEFCKSADLEKFTFLKSMTLAQVVEHLSANGTDVQLVPVNPVQPEEIK